MLTDKERLFIYGFTSDKAHAKMSVEEREKLLKETEDEEEKKGLLRNVEIDKIEVADAYLDEVNYPRSASHYKLVWDTAKTGVEEQYFWIVEHLRQDRGFYEIKKISDLYAATEASAFWGNQQQRISAQQNQAQSLLANIGKFVKELFQMVRELRIIDERLEMYEAWKNKEDGTSKSADVTLKSLFTDQVEQGTKNPQSVFGLAQTVGFTILPDLFFNTHVYSQNELDKTMQDLDVNEQVKNVLRRKLYQFLIWRENTHKELQNRRTFNIRYLQQHWAIIKTYMNWAKPYLKNVRRLQMRDDLDTNPELVSSFDQSITEVEILAKRPQKGGVHPVVIVNFQFRTRPDMNIRKEYQQGPTHSGRLEMSFRSYGWTEQEIKNYEAMRAREDIELLGTLDASIEHIMEALGTDFLEYIKEYEKDLPENQGKKEKDKKKKKKKSVKDDLNHTFEPFVALVGGFIDVGKAFVPKKSKKTSSGVSGARKGAAEEAKFHMMLTWHIFKKARFMLSW